MEMKYTDELAGVLLYKSRMTIINSFSGHSQDADQRTFDTAANCQLINPCRDLYYKEHACEFRLQGGNRVSLYR